MGIVRCSGEIDGYLVEEWAVGEVGE